MAYEVINNNNGDFDPWDISCPELSPKIDNENQDTLVKKETQHTSTEEETQDKNQPQFKLIKITIVSTLILSIFFCVTVLTFLEKDLLTTSVNNLKQYCINYLK